MNIVHDMTVLSTILKRFVIAAAAVSLFACGGGSSTTAPVQTTVSVTPALGGFSAGANVTAVTPAGAVIASGTTGSNGSASLDFAGYSGPFTLVVTGGAGVTYYDEKSGTNLPFTASDTLLATVPATTIKSGVSYGVTPLTNMAAGFAGVDATGVISGSTASVNTVFTNAVAQTQLTVGIPSDQLNILSAPIPVTSTNTKLSGTGTGVTYGLILAEIAKNTATNASSQAAELYASASAARNAGASGAGAIVTGTAYMGVTTVINSFITTPSALGANFFAVGGTVPVVGFAQPQSATTPEQIAAESTKVATSIPQGTTSPVVTGGSN